MTDGLAWCLCVRSSAISYSKNSQTENDGGKNASFKCPAPLNQGTPKTRRHGTTQTLKH
jgi:hypothetical protein